MKNKFSILLIFTMLFAVVIEANAYRGGPDHPRGMRHRHHGPFFGDVERMQELLNLTEKQVQQIRGINGRFREQSRAQDEKMRPHLQQLRQLLLQEKVNLNRIRRKLRQISDIEIELKILQIRHRMELQKVLTPQQKKILKSEWRDMRGKHHHRMERRRRGRMRRFND